MSQLSTFAPQIVPPPGTVVTTLTGNSGGAVPPDGAGNINIIDATTEGTSRIVGNPGTNTLTMSFTDVDQNVIIGTTAFSSTHTVGIAVANTGLGFDVLNAVTTGADNTAIGHNSSTGITTGSSNTSLGVSALGTLLTGSNNIAVGQAAGTSYTGAESSNIIIGNTGTNGESNTIRIGTQGAGAGQQNRAFIAGITGVTVANTQLVTINTATGQLGTTPVFSFNYTNVNFAMSPYTVLATDEYISVDSSGGAVTLRFPNAATLGEAWIVKDRIGNAGTNNITVTTVGGVVLIDGATTFVMNTNFQAINLLGNGTSYEVY